ncbi:MAG: ABC transporter permease [Clostridiales bacterium]|nr:ABC transporter permease [Candidatus Cacconaster stercorequi]
MKKTQWIELLYNIRHTAVSFIAVVLFVALATGLFTGIKWTGYSLGTSVEAEYSDGHFYHFELSYPYGFDQTFIDSLLHNGIADEAEGYYETYRNFQQSGSRYQAKIVSLTESIDRPYCVEGTLPTRKGEAAVNLYWASENGVRVGDVIALEKSSAHSGFFLSAVLEENIDGLLAASDKSDALLTDSYRVTALVGVAEYMGKYEDTNGMSPVSSAPVGAVIYVAEQSFDKSAFCGYPKVVVRTEELNGLLTTSDAYKERSDRLKSTVEAAAQSYASQRNADMRDAAGHMEKMLGELPGGNDSGNMNPRIGQILAALKNVRDYEAHTASRQMNGSFAGLRSVMDTFDKMQYSLVALFVIIGILVCYSIVSRLVYDQTVLIGTKKAIGFFATDILKPFLIYSGIAVAVGTVCGVLLGRFVIEPVMVGSVRETYRFGRVIYYFGIREVLIFALIQAALILTTALFASIRVSRQLPLKLLTGETQVPGSTHRWLEKIPLWNHTSLMQKTIFRNCLNDRRRVFATLIGVMGCTALVVCALSMYDNLVGSFERNMDKVSKYDTIVHFSGDTQTKEELCSLFDENGVPYADSYYSLGAMQTENGEQLVTGLYVTDSADFYELFHLYDADDGIEKQAEHGAWVNIAYVETFGASVGDTMCFTDASGQDHEFTIEGFYEYYLMNYQIVLPRDLYEEEFGVSYEPNTILLRTEGSEFGTIKAAVLEQEDGLLIRDFYGGNKGLFESIAGIARAVVAVYIVLSCVLSVLLLLNLFTMFVNEKKRELITLMINGFPRKNAEQYIYVDTKFLTFIGIAAGIVLGIVMGGISLDSFNNSATHFLNCVDVKACVIGALFTSVLTFIMCRIALRKVRSFRLADINSM